MDYIEFKGKTKNDAITEACQHFSIPSDKLDYEVLEEGKNWNIGFWFQTRCDKGKSERGCTGGGNRAG